jgi:hypothetical protein
MQEDSAMIARRENRRCARIASLIAVGLTIGLVIPVVAVASMTTITLAQLVVKSDVVALGHTSGTPGVQQPMGNTVAFEITTLLKGGQALEAGAIIKLCNPNNNSEWPDLTKMQGDRVIFVAKAGDCYSLVHGYRSIIGGDGGQAWTSVIKGQPYKQPITTFLQKIQVLVRETNRKTQ